MAVVSDSRSLGAVKANRSTKRVNVVTDKLSRFAMLTDARDCKAASGQL